MKARYAIQSSDMHLLDGAISTAAKFAKPFMREGIVGVVFLGAIVRGYFDKEADIDIGIFADGKPDGSFPPLLSHVDGYAVHCWSSNYHEERISKWEMGKRWTYSESTIQYDPQGLVSEMLLEKRRIDSDERKWTLMTGLTLSEWYINRPTNLWVDRGDILSAHNMINQGLNYFYDMLFLYNNSLVPSDKWRSYCAERLVALPDKYKEHMIEVQIVKAITETDLNRRVQAFMIMWKQMATLVEREVGMKYEEFRDTI